MIKRLGELAKLKSSDVISDVEYEARKADLVPAAERVGVHIQLDSWVARLKEKASSAETAEHREVLGNR
jgi:hypothetical protein